MVALILLAFAVDYAALFDGEWHKGNDDDICWQGDDVLLVVRSGA